MGLERKAAVAIAALALAAGSLASAQQPDKSREKDVFACGDRAPLECYLGNVQFTMISCRLTGSTALMKYQMGDRSGLDEVTQCITAGKRATERNFIDAKRALGTNERAIALLKDHYAAFIAGVDDLFPGGVSERAYTAQARATEARLKEMGTRVKLEQ